MVKCLLAAALVVACKSKEPPPSPPPTDVVVVSPGAAPLKSVRYAVAKGTHTTVELATDWKVTAGELGNALPTILTTFDVSCEDIARDGTMKLRAKVLEAAARERADSGVSAAAITAQLKPLDGMSIELMLAPDGRVTPPVFDAPASGSASATGPGSETGTDAAIREQLQQLSASFQQLAMPLPTAPIGLGAKWRTSRKVEQGGMQLTTVTTLDVTALDGTTIGFTLSSEIHGADQTITQDGMAVEIKDVSGSATGKGVIDLTKGVTTGELHFDLRSDMNAAGSSTPMRAQTDIVVR